MNDFLYFIVWSLAVFGASNGIVISDLVAPVRQYLTKKSDFLGKLIHCPLCLGFWVGLLAHFFMKSPTGFWLGDAFLGSSVSWLLYIGIYRRQFDLEGDGKGCPNCGQKESDPQQELLTEDLTKKDYEEILREVHHDS